MAVTAEDLRTALTKAELAVVLNISYRSVDRLIAEGRIEVVRVGTGRGRARITQRALTEYLTRNTDRATPTPAKRRAS